MIIEIETHGINKFSFVEQGFLKGVKYHRTKAVHSQEIITFIFETTTIPQSVFEITPYKNGSETKGIYLGSIARNNDELIHYFYEKKSV